MVGKIIDINSTEAFILLNDGNTIAISLSSLPNNSKIGASINVNSISSEKLMNNCKIPNNFFI
ncbi:hypothetical protein CLHOM_26710 [Clostridium homopropionicum DSM 5847]|uniref:S1 motif domain-containing protein n=1 Tax=Clostridium homopropionicum DSM 5847 TaxID=1121318 RepID=A0A0L6Z7I6_9CLOT|nr:hypothetical protein [Clostridium homopropionicum]KOA18931.1 hypothetical protein CLHOM_26710 [Clostridium homopropionicum DSM 5847]SFG44157.1 hypothetical protein SAMN04488501_10984 [Clostridium homopropionicum]